MVSMNVNWIIYWKATRANIWPQIDAQTNLFFRNGLLLMFEKLEIFSPSSGEWSSGVAVQKLIKFSPTLSLTLSLSLSTRYKYVCTCTLLLDFHFFGFRTRNSSNRWAGLSTIAHPNSTNLTENFRTATQTEIYVQQEGRTAFILTIIFNASEWIIKILKDHEARVCKREGEREREIVFWSTIAIVFLSRLIIIWSSYSFN